MQPNPKQRSLHCEKPFTRTLTLNREHIDVDARTVELSFSSETSEVERWFGVEILDHSPGSVRMERINTGGALLFNHGMDKHIGVIEGARIEEKRGKAIVRFGNSEFAEEKFRDVQDGVLSNVSFMYRPKKMVLETAHDDAPDVYRVMDWEPLEISLVTIPADISVGVGRQVNESFDIEIEERVMDTENTDTPNTSATPAPSVDLVAQRGAIVNEGITGERQRVSDLLSLGKRYANHDGETLARKCIDEGKTVEEFRQVILEQLPSGDQAGTRGDAPADPVLDLSNKDLKDYSLMRAINAVVSARNGDTKAMKAAGLEMECSDVLSDRFGTEARGFYVPLDVVTRVMDASNASDLIGTAHMGSMYIDTLRARSIAMQLGVTAMDNLVENLEIPRGLSDPTFQWIGDDDDAPLSDGVPGMVKMAPKTLAGGVPMSRRLLKQSSPSVEALMQRSLLMGAALGVDYGVLAGSGTGNQPLGVANMTGLNTQAVATPGAPTWAELVGFETKIDADDALAGSLGFAFTPTVRGNLKVTAKDAGSGIFLMGDDGRAAGYPGLASSQLAANTIIFGNWADVYVGFWGVLDLNPDTATKAGSGGLILRVFQDADVGVGHSESFCINQ